METVFLSQVEGFGRKSGTDGYGQNWIEFEFEAQDEDSAPDACAVCEAEVYQGYVNLDGGTEVVCAEHVCEVPKWFTDIIGANHADWIDSQNALVRVRCDIGSTLIGARAEHAPSKYLGWTKPSTN